VRLLEVIFHATAFENKQFHHLRSNHYRTDPAILQRQRRRGWNWANAYFAFYISICSHDHFHHHSGLRRAAPCGYHFDVLPTTDVKSWSWRNNHNDISSSDKLPWLLNRAYSYNCYFRWSAKHNDWVPRWASLDSFRPWRTSRRPHHQDGYRKRRKPWLLTPITVTLNAASASHWCRVITL